MSKKQARFAALIRVSTDKQEKKGESLRTQASQIDQAVASIGGKITKRYAGQEHGTAGWERVQLSQLLADAVSKSRPFDAVIIADVTRWSRDNVASSTGLETLRDAGVRFFVLNTEYDLFKPETRLFLGMSAEIGAYHARSQKLKSIENRIARAKRGVPTCGKFPFGRVWDAETEKWEVDKDKQEMVRDCAERYLAGESMPKLAREYHVNHSSLCKILRERCGDKWDIEFRAHDLNINETVTLTIPRLLPEKTIREIKERLVANRTYLHKPPQPTHDYLLSGRIFCSACGYCMFGQMNHGNRRYYRHAHVYRVRNCPLQNPKPWVRADVIEAAVIRQLFELYGNPAAIERAIKAAVPDCEKAIKRRSNIEEELNKLERGRDRVLDHIERDTITQAQADKKLRDMSKREAELRAELERLNDELANVPDAKTIEVYREQFGQLFELYDQYGNRYAGGNDISSFVAMKAADRRKLVDFAFAGMRPDGKPTGVYVTPMPGQAGRQKKYTYQLIGIFGGVKPRALP